MTEANYKQQIPDDLKGAGACFVAALDCISKKHSEPESMYQKWIEVYWKNVSGDGYDSHNMYSLALSEVGATLGDIDMGHAASEKELKTKLQKITKGWRGVVALEDRHDVGVIPGAFGKWKLVGDVNGHDHVVVSTSQLYGMLDKSDPNIFNYMLLPEEK